MTITHSFENIGPREAAKILLKVHPRQAGRHHQQTIDSYAFQMDGGSWDADVVQTISISSSGELVDGWHRLHAIIKSGMVIRMLVVRGINPEAFSKYDAGKSRSLAFRCGIDKEEAALASLMYRIVKYSGLNRAPAVEEVEKAMGFIRSELETFRALTSTTRRRKLTAARTQLAVLLRMKQHPQHHEAICRNYTVLQHGDLTGAPRVIGALYRRLLEERHTAMMAFGLSYMAFDPDKCDISRVVLRDLPALIRSVREGVMAPLVDALE